MFKLFKSKKGKELSLKLDACLYDIDVLLDDIEGLQEIQDDVMDILESLQEQSNKLCKMVDDMNKKDRSIDEILDNIDNILGVKDEENKNV